MLRFVAKRFGIVKTKRQRTVGGTTPRPAYCIEPAAVPPSAFICGCGHTGTSILMAILAAHPDIYVPPRETNAFIGSDQDACRNWSALIEEHAASGRRFLVEKTPLHIRHLDRIRAMVPGARFILTVRDGRDVAVSISEREKRTLAMGQERWIADTGIVAAQIGRRGCLLFRYEDFVENPEGTVEGICSLIGVTFVPEMLEYHRKPRLWFDQTAIHDASPSTAAGFRAHRNWQVNQPIFDGRGKWRRTHTQSDFPALASGDGLQLMRRFGYA